EVRQYDMNCGAARTERIPIIPTTTISSVSENPASCLVTSVVRRCTIARLLHPKTTRRLPQVQGKGQTALRPCDHPRPGLAQPPPTLPRAPPAPSTRTP